MNHWWIRKFDFFGWNSHRDDQPLAKTAAKPTALRDWEQQAITSVPCKNQGWSRGSYWMVLSSFGDDSMENDFWWQVFFQCRTKGATKMAGDDGWWNGEQRVKFIRAGWSLWPWENAPPTEISQFYGSPWVAIATPSSNNALRLHPSQPPLHC